MHKSPGPYDVTAEVMHEALMAQADAKHGHATRERADHCLLYTSDAADDRTWG